MRYSLTFVFYSCGLAAAQVALFLVLQQDLPGGLAEAWIDAAEGAGDVFMYRRFGDAELFCRCPDGRLVFDDVHGQITGPFLHEVLQRQHSLHIVLHHPMSRFRKLFRNPGFPFY